MIDLRAPRTWMLGWSLLDAWSIVVAFTFIGAGVARFIPATGVEAELRALGLPFWLIVLSGVWETLAGGLMLVRPARAVGSAMAGASMLGALVANVMAGAYVDAVSPVILGLMALSVLVAYRQQVLRWLPSATAGTA